MPRGIRLIFYSIKLFNQDLNPSHQMLVIKIQNTTRFNNVRSHRDQRTIFFQASVWLEKNQSRFDRMAGQERLG